MESNKVIDDFFVEAFNYILSREEEDFKTMGVDNLTIVEVHVLDAVNKVTNKTEPTMKEVAKFLGISKGSLTVSSDRLIKKGYLEKSIDKTDRRKKFLKLTESGKEMCKIHDDWHVELTRTALDCLSEHEEEVLVTALKNILKMMREGNE